MADDTTERLLAALERQKLERDLAVAKRDEWLARLPKGEAKGIAGDVTVKEGGGYFAEILAYRALGDAAAAVAAAVEQELAGRPVVLTGRSDLLTADAPWRLLDGRTADFEREFEALFFRYRTADGSPNFTVRQTSAAAVLPGVLGAASEVAAFFRVQREILGRPVRLAESAALAEVARHLDSSAGVWLPSMPGGVAPASLVERLRRLRAAQRDALALRRAFETRLAVVDPGRLEEINNERAELQARRPEIGEEEFAIKSEELAVEESGLRNALGQWGRVQADFDPLLAEFADFDRELTTVPAGTGRSLLDLVSEVDAVRSLGPEARLLIVQIVSQGAELHIAKTAWTSGRLHYVGGVVLQYVLLDPECGRVLASGLVPVHRRETRRAAERSLEP
ncbi:MAG: hypothetical protein SF066_07040 [Thermoanaerobaculia bacterium]|nr:hypothetical protein [Thermoanaerobaculia bacterium]